MMDRVEVHGAHLSLYLLHLLSELTFYLLNVTIKQEYLMVEHSE